MALGMKKKTIWSIAVTEIMVWFNRGYQVGPPHEIRFGELNICKRMSPLNVSSCLIRSNDFKPFTASILTLFSLYFDDVAS